MLVDVVKNYARFIEGAPQKKEKKEGAMGYQFIHVEAYARVGSKQKGKEQKWSIKEIIAEAVREPEACSHVEQPAPPVHLYGVALDEVEGLANEWASTQKDAKGRKMRADGLALLAGVVSVKREDEDLWPSVRADTLEYLKSKYGERLRCVIEHTDEEHPHIHFYVVPLPGEKFDQVHEGRRASAVAKAEGKKKGEQNLAYIEAMRCFQDEFSDEVALPNGLTRIGPRGRRLSRAGWHQEQQKHRALANLKAVAEVGYKKGFKQGYAKGKERARAEFEKIASIGAKVGEWFAGAMGGFHKPTKEAQRALDLEKQRVEEERERAQKRQANAIQQAEEEASRRVQLLQAELEKQERIASNAVADAERYREQAELATAQIRHQRGKGLDIR